MRKILLTLLLFLSSAGCANVQHDVIPESVDKKGRITSSCVTITQHEDVSWSQVKDISLGRFCKEKG